MLQGHLDEFHETKLFFVCIFEPKAAFNLNAHILIVCLSTDFLSNVTTVLKTRPQWVILLPRVKMFK